MQVKSKNDYLKYGKRADVHTSTREDLYQQFQIECIKLNQPQTKAMDVILQMVLKDEKLLTEFKNRIRTY